MNGFIDKRRNTGFEIDHRVIDEWLPIIQKEGFALYALIVSRADRAQHDDFDIPPARETLVYLSAGLPTLRQYAWLMEACGLIAITPGQSFWYNCYVVNDVPVCDEQTRTELRGWLNSDERLTDGFRRRILRHLDNYGCAPFLRSSAEEVDQ